MSADRWTRFSVDWCQEPSLGGSGIIFLWVSKVGVMRRKPLLNNPEKPLAEINPNPSEHADMDPDARAAAILERLDKLRKKVTGIRKDLEEIERDLLEKDQGRDLPKL
jgi:hypothetical protein